MARSCWAPSPPLPSGASTSTTTFSINRAGFVALLGTTVLLAACSGIGRQINHLPSNAAARGFVLLPKPVPLPKSRLTSDCGPESIAAVIHYWGKTTTVEDTSRAVRNPKIEGVFSSDLPLLARQKGLQANFLDGSVGRIKKAIDRGVPPIIMVYVGSGDHHFFVVSGYNDVEQMVVCEEYENAKRLIAYTELEAQWETTGHVMLEMEPSSVEADTRAAKNLETEGLYAEAVLLYKRALTVDPGHAEARLGLGNCYLGLRKLEEALEEYKRAQAADSDDPRVCNNLANILLELKRDPAEAEKLAERAVERFQSAFETARGEAERETQPALRAIREKRMADRERDLAHGLGTLGQARAANGKHPMAVAAWKASYEHLPLTDVYFRAKRLYEMGLAYRELSMPSEARKNLQQALEIVRDPALRAQIEAALR